MKISTTKQRLNELLRESNMRPIDLVKKCQPYCEKYNIKMGRNDISQYLSGKVEPSQKKLSILAKALDVDEVWLMGYDIENQNITPKEEFKLLKKVLTEKGFLDKNENMTEEDFDKLIDFAKRNKDFLKKE